MRLVARGERLSMLRATMAAWWCIGVVPLFAEDLVVRQRGAMIIIQEEEPPLLGIIDAAEFDDRVRGGTADAAKMTSRCAALLAREIEVLDKVCSLSDVQKRKLGLAGRGDIKTFVDRTREMRERVVGVPMQDEVRQVVIAKIDKLRTTNRWDLFHEESLFRKTLQKNITEEQTDRLVEWVVAEWDLRVRDVTFDADVQRRLARLLRAKSDPPLGWTYYTYHVLSLQMAALENEVRPLVVVGQWPAFEQQLAEAKKLEPKLRELGAWPVRNVSESEE